MEPIRNAKNLSLYWVQPKTMQRRFLLHSGEHEFASLEFQSAFGSLAVAETVENAWSFKRVGFFNPRVTVRRSGEQLDLGTYQPRWTGTEGTLIMAGGRSFQWKVTNFWATSYTFQDSAGEPLLWFKEGSEESHISNVFKIQALVAIEPPGWQLAELDLLLTLGWYLLILHHDDAAAATTAATD
jgi:hypothetical protein